MIDSKSKTPRTDAIRKNVMEGKWSLTEPGGLLDNMEEFEQQLSTALKERDEWKANHDNQVELRRALMDRPDLKERAKLVQALEQDRDNWQRIAEKLLGYACHGYCASNIPHKMDCSCGLTALRAELETLKTKGK